MPESDWTLPAAMEHFRALRQADLATAREQRDSDQRAIKAALDAAEKAADKADLAMDKRLEGMNEFRKTVDDQAKDAKSREADFVLRKEFEPQIGSLTTQIADLKNELGKAQGRREGLGSTGQLIFQGIVAAGVVASIIFSVLARSASPAPQVIYAAPPTSSPTTITTTTPSK
jgi:hypothetical protein